MFFEPCLANPGRPMQSYHKLLLILLLWFAAIPGLRAEVEFEWDGFGSIGASVLDDDALNQANITAHSIFEEGSQADVDSRLGLQGTAEFGNTLSATMQLVAYTAEDDDLEVEWAYLTYDVNQNTKLRIGRLRRPFYANSDFLPVGYVYPWARPPLEVYSRDVSIFDNLDAIDLLYQGVAGDWDLTAEIYFGGSSDRAEVAPGENGDYSTSDDLGIILGLEKDWFNLRFGYHRSPDIDADTSTSLQSLFDGLEAASFDDIASDMDARGLRGEFVNLATNIDYEDWLLALELVYIPIEGGLAPDEESWYLMGGRRMGPWTIHLTYSERIREFDGDFSAPVDDLAALVGPPGNAGLLALSSGIDAAEDGIELEYHSYTLGLRYDFAEPVSIKAEYQYITDEKNDLSSNLFSLVVDFLF